MNIRSTITGSVADFERCAGRCKIAAETIDGSGGDQSLYDFLIGAYAGISALQDMEYGDDEERFLNKVLNRRIYESTD